MSETKQDAVVVLREALEAALPQIKACSSAACSENDHAQCAYGMAKAALAAIRFDTCRSCRAYAPEIDHQCEPMSTPEQRSAEMRRRAEARWAQWREARDTKEGK